MAPPSTNGGGASKNGRTTGESFTNSSVEYFLLDDNHNTVGGGSICSNGRQHGSNAPFANNNNNNNNNHNQQQQQQQRSDSNQDLLCTPFRDEAGLHNDASERFCFDDELTVPSSGFNRGRLGTGTSALEDDTEVNSLFYSPGGGGGPGQGSSARILLRHDQPAMELNGLNYLNAVTYIFHLFVSWGVGVWGLDNVVKTRWEITVAYETLVTPAEWASFYVLAVIMVLESVFTLAQLLPYYRARPIIQAGTGFFFFYTFLWQTAWTLFYCFELFIFSFVAMMGTLISLVMLLLSQEQHNSSNGMGAANPLGSTHLLEYFLFRFPFYLHTGWMVCLTVGHVSLLFRNYSANTGLQVAADIVSLALMLPVATYSLGRAYNDFVIPLVMLLSYIGIASRLIHPSDAMLDLYGPIIIEAVRRAAYTLAGIVGCCWVPNVVVWFTREFCTINVVELD